MPAFTFKDFVQGGARTNRRRHGAKHARMRFFLERAFPQKFLHVLFAGEGALGLFVKFSFLPFLRSFHSANGDFGSSDFIPPTAEPTHDCVLQSRRFCTEVPEFSFPTLRMALFRFGHSQKNLSAFLIVLALGQITIRLRGLHFGLPIPLNDVDRLAPIFRLTGSIFALHVRSICRFDR
jgi:hypothetical protein